MSSEAPHPEFTQLKRRYLLLRFIELMLLAAGTALLTYGLATVFVSWSWSKIFLSLFAGVVVFVVRAFHYKLFRLNDNMFALFLNTKYPILKESADLLVRNDNGLTPLQQLQKIQTRREFNSLQGIQLPHHIFQATGVFVACAISYFVLTSFSFKRNQASPDTQGIVLENKAVLSDTITIHLTGLSVNIAPPRYTQLKPFTSPSQHLSVPEGSMVTWFATFNGKAKSARLIFSGSDSTELTATKDNNYSYQKLISTSGFYQVQWTDARSTYLSDFYKIEVTEDQAPKVDITNLLQFTKLRLTDDLHIDVKSSLRDDHGLMDADIVATVSKGSGESVKFREEKLRFDSPIAIAGKDVHASVRIDLLKLGLEPGDELYFYVQALDNKTPTPNHARTETYFISLQDTTSEITVADAGLGVDLMPEYFRSQRQIIIDTEKLLREKKKLTRQVFNSTSNELGYDQKVLRLKYGQFLGEEADSGIGQQVVAEEKEDAEDEKDKDPSKEFGHKHDTENEHNLVDTKKDHNHDGEVKDPEEKEDPMKEFMHSHDNTEEATFFFQSVRAKLKAALTLMWDAELYLRLYEPAKSLPYQYKILNLLKEISNDSRIYVHRTGFDPPPLKEDKRLTADLSDVKTSTSLSDREEEVTFPGIRNALLLIEELLGANRPTLTDPEKKVLTAAGQELATVAIEQPGVHIKTLSRLKSLIDDQVKPDDTRVLTEIRRALWQALPDATLSPSRQMSTPHPLDQKFLNSLEDMKHE